MLQEIGSEQDGQGTGKIHLSGPMAEIEMLRAMLCGACYLSAGENGAFNRHERLRPLPDPIDDPALAEAWQTNRSVGIGYRTTSHVSPDEGWHNPSYFVSHLCGYDYSTGGYKHNAARLESYGFKCMRSRRGTEGRFWEFWYLPGIWAAKGELKTAAVEFSKSGWQSESHQVVKFLCDTVRFGSCDVAVQRAAMTIE